MIHKNPHKPARIGYIIFQVSSMLSPKNRNRTVKIQNCPTARIVANRIVFTFLAGLAIKKS